MQFVPFNSRDIRHKSVFGSTAAGESLWLSVVMPRDMGVEAVRLVSHADYGPCSYASLDWKDTDGYTEWWSVNYTFTLPGVYFYHFEYDTPWGTGKIFLHSAGAGLMCDSGGEWQQTVYDPASVTPDRFKGGVMYQIFPDRFCASGEKKENVPSDRRMHADLSERPDSEPDPVTGRWNTDYFGGDLKGIESRLDYLAGLGVTYIYLNPIFEAHSNHRYDTADYMRIDPLLGTEEDFRGLCGEAKKRGIGIILDGVFSHTGDDSLYFNKYNRYDTVGAYNSEASPFVRWYKFRTWNEDYDCWWGIKSMPETDETDPDYCRYIDGVVRKWMSAGASGFRLDVADELPDVFIERIRKDIKDIDPEGVLIGEVWEDASNKISHGGRRRYLLGSELDGVMNYPFRTAIIDFLLNADAERFNDSVLTVCENYPKQNLDCLMNILGTHDTERILSVLGGQTGEKLSRRRQASAHLGKKARERAERLLGIAYIMLYTLPGVPCVYYGDEACCEGLRDPFNRGFFPWGRENTGVSRLLKALAELRRGHRCLKDGVFGSVSAAMGCVAYTRRSGDDRLLVIVNKNPGAITYYLPEEWHNADCITGQSSNWCSVELAPESAAILV